MNHFKSALPENTGNQMNQKIMKTNGMPDSPFAMAQTSFGAKKRERNEHPLSHTHIKSNGNGLGCEDRRRQQRGRQNAGGNNVR